MQRIRITTLALALVAASGCLEKADGEPSEAPAKGLNSSPTWILQQITVNGTAHKAIPNAKATISFGRKDVRGSTGCNSFGGTYSAKTDGSLTLDDIAMTAMGCPGPRMTQEDRFSKVLWKVKHYKVDATGLTLSDGTAKNQLKYIPYVPKPMALMGTTWTLTHFTQSDAQTVSAEPAQRKTPITLIIKDGEVNGSGGCNRYTSHAVVKGEGKITFRGVGATKKLCHGGIGKHEAKYFGMLPEMTHYTIREKTLTLSNDDGTQGMQFQAR